MDSIGLVYSIFFPDGCAGRTRCMVKPTHTLASNKPVPLHQDMAVPKDSHDMYVLPDLLEKDTILLL